MALWQLHIGDGRRLAVGPADRGPQRLLAGEVSLDGLLAGPAGAFAAALAEGGGEPVPDGARIAAPIEGQEVWAAGVTYRRSRDARKEESDDPDHYDRVYDADRPELFFKATAWRVRGPGDPIGVRADSGWDVPEPELGLVCDARGDIVGYVIGNDVSSRSIEGENPLYLPQAKSYTGSCALGPCLVSTEEVGAPEGLEITLAIHRDGEMLYTDRVSVGDLKRRPDELAGWLYKALDFPRGAVLLTGTAIVPDRDFTLRAGDEVRVAITGLGELRNPVEVVGG